MLCNLRTKPELLPTATSLLPQAKREGINSLPCYPCEVCGPLAPHRSSPGDSSVLRVTRTGSSLPCHEGNEWPLLLPRCDVTMQRCCEAAVSEMSGQAPHCSCCSRHWTHWIRLRPCTSPGRGQVAYWPPAGIAPRFRGSATTARDR